MLTLDQAVIRLRVQVKQLACAAATQCLRDRMTRKPIDHPLVELDALARQLAAPALEALSVIAGEEQGGPDSPAGEAPAIKQVDNARHSTREGVNKNDSV